MPAAMSTPASFAVTVATLALSLGGVAHASPAATALRVAGPLSPRIASYRIDARLDESTRDVRGTTRLTWRNAGTAPAGVLTFHLYMNAFASERTHYFEPEWRWSKEPVLKAGEWGFIETGEARVTGSGRAEEKARLAVIDDGTVATLTLARAVLPGETIEITTPFVTHLPTVVSRAGAAEGFYAVAQWFPKIGVWRCTPTCAFAAAPYYHDSEFFSDFGVYDVTLDVPKALTVGATGVLVASHDDGDRKHLVYHAEDVHDFAWSADARFVAHTEAVDDGSGLPPVTVIVLGAPEVAANVPRHMEALRAGLAELGARLGAYPYSTLTVVQPPRIADEAAGMEYPTFFFTRDSPAPPGLPRIASVTTHELAHQWFQGMLASNEVDDPWLDEGFADAATGWVLERWARERGSVAFLGHGGHVNVARVLLDDEDSDAITTGSDGFRDENAYATLVYQKTALLLDTLRLRMGDDAFFAAIRRYADAQRFHHPTRADLVAAFAGAAPELRAFLDRVLAAPGALDYAVTSVRTAKARPPASRDGAAAPAVEGHHSEVVVEALGELRLPVTLRAWFADGSHADRVLPAGDPAGPRWQRVSFDSKSALRSAELYPARDTPLDVHPWNDGLRVEPDARPRRRIVDSLRLFIAATLAWLVR